MKMSAKQSVARLLMLTVLGVMLVCPAATAFSSSLPLSSIPAKWTGTSSSRTQPRQHHSSRSSIIRILRATGDDGKSDDAFKGMELTSALARMDRQWQIEQSNKAPGQTRWTKLILSDTNDNDFCYLLEPPSSASSFSSTTRAPSCLISFVGGAGLGQFPQIAYNEFLLRLSDQLNAAILVAPYTVSLDHWELAKQTGDALRRAMIQLQDERSDQYPASLPVYALSHSLGCKLQTIYVAATSQNYQGLGFISYNNFGFGQTLQMARQFAEQLLPTNTNTGYNNNNDVRAKSDEALNMIFGMAETVLNAVGLDFQPSAKDTERLVQLKFKDDLKRKTRLFVMDDDTLDSSQQFFLNTQANGSSSSSSVSTSGITGTHLTPVFIKLGVDDFPTIGEGDDFAKEMIREIGYTSASFGDEGNMKELVQEVVNWVLGKDPSRPAHWDKVAPKLTSADPN